MKILKTSLFGGGRRRLTSTAIMMMMLMLLLSAAVFLTGACGGAGGGDHGGHNQNSPGNGAGAVSNPASAQQPTGGGYSATVAAEPAGSAIAAGKPASLVFTITRSSAGGGGGETVRNFAIVHEKALHAIVVSPDLSEFYHLHADTARPDGTLKIDFSFPHGGDYKVFLDFTPAGADRAVVPLDVKVSDADDKAPAAAAAAPPGNGSKPSADAAPLVKTVDGLRFSLTVSGGEGAGGGGNGGSGAVTAEMPTALEYVITDAASGAAPADLENYLGEPAHFVIVSGDLKDFVHAHPNGGGGGGGGGGGEHEGMKMDGAEHEGMNHAPAAPGQVSAMVTFPRAGVYRIWAQFQRRGKVVTVPFTINVAPASSVPPDESKFPAGAQRVVVSKNGYEPDGVTLAAGAPRKIAFYRADGQNCGDEVVFKDLGIRRKLPVGEVVVVEIPADAKAGEIGFTCGMNMLRGKVVVQ